jgi:hypothetical protein
VRLPAAGLVAVVVLALAVGLWGGNNTAVGDKTLHVLTGTAMLHDRTTFLTSFDDGNADDQKALYANDIWWEDGSDRGQRDPPCLHVGRKARVRIGYTWVAHPGGGSHPVVVWLECL